MPVPNSQRFLLTAVAILSVCGWFINSKSQAEPPRGGFSNPIVQRDEVIRELAEIKALLKEQNQILRSNQRKN